MSRFVAFVSLFVIGTLSSASAVRTLSDSASISAVNKWREMYIAELNSTIVLVNEYCDQENLASVNQAYDNKYNQLMTCYDENFNATEMTNVIFLTLFTSDHTLIPKTVCRRFSALVECYYDIFNIVRPCLNETQRYWVTMFMNETDTTLDFICRDEQRNFNNFIITNGFPCLMDRQEEVKSCIENKKKKNNNKSSNKSVVSVTSESTDRWLVEKCDNLSDLHNCWVDSFRKCSNQTPANMIDALFSKLIEASHCENPTVNPIE